MRRFWFVSLRSHGIADEFKVHNWLRLHRDGRGRHVFFLSVLCVHSGFRIEFNPPTNGARQARPSDQCMVELKSKNAC